MKSTFLKIFGDSPTLKVLDFMIVNDDFDYSMTDIARLSEVGYSTLKQFWGQLESEKVVVLTRIVGKAKMYRLNYKNPVMRKFRKFYWETAKQQIRK